MAIINITRAHALDDEHARQLAGEVAEELGENLGLSYDWRDDVLHFSGTGISGNIDVADSAVRVSVRLGLLLTPMKAPIERGIHRRLDALLSEA